MTYWASFTSTVNQYPVTFYDEDGITILPVGGDNSKSYPYDTPAALVERPADPTKAATDSHTYTFAGWSPAIADVTGNATYTATYTPVAKEYTITLNPDGGVIE